MKNSKFIETLREALTEQEFRKYLVHQFVLAQGKSGKVYQIFRGRNHIKVWQNGRMMEEICVFIRDKEIPPTDAVIAFKVIAETDEDELHRMGNVYMMGAAA